MQNVSSTGIDHGGITSLPSFSDWLVTYSSWNAMKMQFVRINTELHKSKTSLKTIPRRVVWLLAAASLLLPVSMSAGLKTWVRLSRLVLNKLLIFCFHKSWLALLSSPRDLSRRLSFVRAGASKLPPMLVLPSGLPSTDCESTTGGSVVGGAILSDAGSAAAATAKSPSTEPGNAQWPLSSATALPGKSQSFLKPLASRPSARGLNRGLSEVPRGRLCCRLCGLEAEFGSHKPVSNGLLKGGLMISRISCSCCAKRSSTRRKRASWCLRRRSSSSAVAVSSAPRLLTERTCGAAREKTALEAEDGLSGPLWRSMQRQGLLDAACGPAC
mmetsp:Transcript_37041/g.84174  ORF Transcript_37041/g.84174 Transcript_37041/m.84174 type:complete len:328 (-) Transcript_37041:12-995(-)